MLEGIRKALDSLESKKSGAWVALEGDFEHLMMFVRYGGQRFADKFRDNLRSARRKFGVGQKKWRDVTESQLYDDSMIVWASREPLKEVVLKVADKSQEFPVREEPDPAAVAAPAELAELFAVPEFVLAVRGAYEWWAGAFYEEEAALRGNSSAGGGSERSSAARSLEYESE
jgi:hypothetical protein